MGRPVTERRCPICRRELPAPPLGGAPPGDAPPHPFCSARCKLLDLGNWLDGSYRIPGPSAFPDDDDPGDLDGLPS